MVGWLEKINIEKNIEFVTKHPNYLVRWKAAELLGEKGGSSVLDSLNIALKDDHPDVRKAAQAAIDRIKKNS